MPDTFTSSILDPPAAPYLDAHTIHILENDEDRQASRCSTTWSMDLGHLLPVLQTCPSHAPLSLYPSTTLQFPVGQYVSPIPRGLPLEPTNIANMINYVINLCEQPPKILLSPSYCNLYTFKQMREDSQNQILNLCGTRE